METDEKRHGGKEAAALSGGHLCHVCGYQYPNPHPSAKLRRSHRKHCVKALPSSAAAAEAVVEVEEAAVGEREEGAGDRNAAARPVLGGEGGRQREEIGTTEVNGGGAALRGSVGEVDSCVEDKVIAADECILSASSASENGKVVGPEDIPVRNSSELVNKTCLTDHGLQVNGHTSGDIFVPSQAASTELSTISMQDISVLSEVEEITQTEDASAKDMNAVRSIDCIEMKQAINTTANDTYAANVEEKKLMLKANVEEKKLIEGTAAGMNEVRQTDYVEEQTQASDTKELSGVQNMGNFEENKQTEDTDAKETNAWFNANDDEHKTQTAKEMAAAESTCGVEEKQQLNMMVGQDGNNNKLNEEIASTGAQLNSGRVRVPLKVLLAEASMENQVKKPSTKERVLSFGRRVTKDSNLSGKLGSTKSGSDDHHWSSPAKLPHKDVDKSYKEKKQEKKQPWMPFICCHSVR